MSSITNNLFCLLAECFDVDLGCKPSMNLESLMNALTSSVAMQDSLLPMAHAWPLYQEPLDFSFSSLSSFNDEPNYLEDYSLHEKCYFERCC